MNTVGSLVLLLAVGLFIVLGIGSFNDISDQVNSSNDSQIVDQTASVDSVLNPTVYLFGFLILIIGAVVAIDAYK